MTSRSENEEEIIKLIKEQKKSIKEVENTLKVSKKEIKQALENKGFSTRTYSDLFSVNHNYFSEINTPSKAYWLGFLYADGCVCGEKVCLEITDKEHVEKFYKAIEAEGYIIRKAYRKREGRKDSITYSLQVKSSQMVQDLIKYGCVPKKSLLLKELPDLESQFLSHFIRGYYDGDGRISFVDSENHYRIDICGQELFLEKIKKFLGATQKLRKRKGANVYIWGCSGELKCKEYLDCLYKDSTEENRLNRKYNLYLDMLKNIIKKQE